MPQPQQATAHYVYVTKISPECFAVSSRKRLKARELDKNTHNLQFHCLALKLNSPDLEINSNGTDVAFGVRVICKTQQKTRL